MKWTLTLLLCLGAFTLAPTFAHASRKLYSINVGNNAPPSGQPELKPLHYADDDAVRFFRLLGTDPRRARLLATLDPDTQRRYPDLAERALAPSFEQLRATMLAMRTQIAQDKKHGDQPVVFFTFSGHGANDEAGRPALALVDLPLTQERLHDELLPLLAEAEVHLIVDACRASGVIGVRGAFDKEVEGQTEPVSHDDETQFVEARSLARFANVGALVATQADQETHEWSRIESGVFSHEVLSALRGAADVNGDLALAYSEVQAFVAAANRDVPNPKARPSVLTHLPGRRTDHVLLALEDLQGARLLYGDAGTLGHFYVELATGERLLDAHLSKGHRTALALPTLETSFLRHGEREAELEPGVEPVALAQLSFHDLQETARGSVERSLRDKLWASSFGPVYYRGFVDSTGGTGVSFGSTRAIPVDRSIEVRRSRKRALAISSAAVAGVAFSACAVSLLLALSSKSDFEETERERAASEHRDAFERRARTAIALGAVTALASAGAVWFWPRVSRDERSGTQVSLEGRVRF
jgi:hypothetical protein